ncbi:TIGR03364 family FAD-dependent oxidoreductase [Lacihabitans lacunae]|uniref:TIGR03364 family FAD-dependent oxidoreductase n=1 Tax=Lacihabitans lacunae TaxID=1028214 RepID=A0ABV7YUD4_9BACT
MKYDLIVVGGGVLGTFSAYHALKKGLSVLLVEKDNQASGSTVQNFGQVVPSGFGKKWCNIGRRSLETYGEIQEKVDITFTQNGSVYIASDAEECQLIHELHQIQDTNGYASELLSKEQLAHRFPDFKATYGREGLFFRDDASVDPSQMIHKLQAYMVAQMGLVFKSNETVIAIEESSAEVGVQTSSGKKFLGDRVWVHSGYVFNLLYPEVFQNSGLVVSQLQMLKTLPLHNYNLKSNILTGLTIRRYEAFEECPSFSKLSKLSHYALLQKYGIHILFKQEADGSVIIGDSHEYASCNEMEKLGLGSKEIIDELMIVEAQRILDFPKSAISRRWIGRYSQHKDEVFEYDVSKRIHICTGIGGKGMTSGAGYTEMKIEAAGF